MIRVILALLLASGTTWGQQQQAPQTPREPPPPSRIMLAGTIVLADGSTRSDQLEVSLICAGKQLRKAHTDSEGRFTIEVSNRPTGATTAGEDAGPLGSTAPWPGPAVGPSSASSAITGIFPSVGAGRVDMTSCELRADPIEGYRTASLHLGIRKAMGSPNVGVIVLPRSDGAASEPIVSVNTAASDDARRAVWKAQAHLRGEKPDYKKARKELEKALRDSPEFSLAWGMLGQLRLREEEPEKAREAFEKAIESQPGYDLPYLELARLDARAKNWQECAERTTKLIELNPNVAEAYYLHGAAHFYLGQAEVALTSFGALEQRPAAERFPRSFFMHGMILARQNQIPEAARRFESFLRFGAADTSLDSARAQVEQQLNTWAQSGVITREVAGSSP